jgi:hypothetical protein
MQKNLRAVAVTGRRVLLVLSYKHTFKIKKFGNLKSFYSYLLNASASVMKKGQKKHTRIISQKKLW